MTKYKIHGEWKIIIKKKNGEKLYLLHYFSIFSKNFAKNSGSSYAL